jgi:hypothetical protein
MTYASPAWEFATESHLIKLQRLQKRVLRTIGNFPRRTPVRDLHMAFKIQNSPFSSPTDEISRILWNLKVHYCVPQEPASGPYDEPDDSSPHPHILLFLDPF